ncbi:uncharacterized protein C8A04DRAFT_13666 [Dichotomopilus funicola]|uniref:Uncharacterized protein n=1 Tax=Dichotomopilus funicola TaxID=1934379 RepID=A0AAN6UZ75_9PEZI|nr:hypothetical protein C8A04DRAFT_13666 [Dichotomopilus funicola]
MPSFTTRRYTPDRLRSLSAPEDDPMDDITTTTTSVLGPPGGSKRATPSLVPSDGSLLDYFDLPSPPSTPHRAAPSSLSYSSLNSFPSPATSPGYTGAAAKGAGSSSGSGSSSPASGSGSPSPLTSVLPRWPTVSQRIHRVLPTRPRSRSVSSSSSASSSSSTTTTLRTRPGARDMDMDMDTHMSGTDPLLNPNPGLGLSDLTMGEAAAAAAGGGPTPIYRTARRTPYYPPNASRNVDRTRVFMQRGPHYVPNWTPLSSLPRHVQLRIEESMTRFTAD